MNGRSVFLWVGLQLVMACKDRARPLPEPEPAPQFNVDAQTLWNDYTRDKVAAALKYDAGPFRLTGTYASTTFPLGVVLDVGSESALDRVSAYFDERERTSIGKLKKGDRVQMICRGMSWTITGMYRVSCHELVREK